MTAADYVLLEDGSRLDGELCGAAAETLGEVVFNTGMTGYQESVTDPSYAGQIITFTYPLIGNYGVSATAMESDAVQARGVIMRESKNGEDFATAERGWLDWLEDCGVTAITGIDTRALVRHIRDAGAMRGGIFAAATPIDEARERIAAEPAMEGSDLARTVTPQEPIVIDGDGPHVVGLDTGIKLSIIRQFRERGCRVTLLPCGSSRRGGPEPRSRSRLPRQRARRPGSARLRRRDTSASSSASDRYSASASVISSSAGRSASTPSSCPSATAARTIRSRTSRPAGSTSPPRTTASPSPGPTARRAIEADEPVRWETDFGAAELSHLNLYDRTVEGLKLRDVPGCTVQYHPEAGPGAARRALPVRPVPGAGLMPRRKDISKILLIGSGPIVIGQAAEFDYSGTQACKVLREEGYEIVLVNSNPATIMTDPEFADRTYVEPLVPGRSRRIIERERPDALLPTLGGQTALNLAKALHDDGTLERFGVELIGADYDAIHRAEDREAFRETMERRGCGCRGR